MKIIISFQSIKHIYQIILMIFQYPIKEIFSFTTIVQFISFCCSFLYLGITIAGTIVFLLFTFQYVKDKDYLKKTILTSIQYAFGILIGLFSIFLSFILSNINEEVLEKYQIEINDYPFQQVFVFLLFISLLLKTCSTLNMKFVYGNIIWLIYMIMIRDWSCLYILIPIVSYHLGGHLFFYFYHQITSFKWMIGTEIITLLLFLFCNIKSIGSFCLVMFILTLCEIINFGTTAGITYNLYEIDHSTIINSIDQNNQNVKIDKKNKINQKKQIIPSSFLSNDLQFGEIKKKND